MLIQRPSSGICTKETAKKLPWLFTVLEIAKTAWEHIRLENHFRSSYCINVCAWALSTIETVSFVSSCWILKAISKKANHVTFGTITFHIQFLCVVTRTRYRLLQNCHHWVTSISAELPYWRDGSSNGFLLKI